MYTYTHIYIYIERERERDRERDTHIIIHIVCMSIFFKCSHSVAQHVGLDLYAYACVRAHVCIALSCAAREQEQEFRI